MNHFFHIEGVASALAILSFTGALIRLVYLRWRQMDDTVEFVGQLKSNHLPHIYRALQVISFHMGIHPDELEPPEAHEEGPR
jgi:hypothetical protein